MARTKNTKRGIGMGRRGQQHRMAVAKFLQKEKEKDNPDEPKASTSKVTPQIQTLSREPGNRSRIHL